MSRESFHFKSPWRAIEGNAHLFEAEIERELAPGHPLFRLPVSALALLAGQDDVLVHVHTTPERFAVVHCTRSGHAEPPPDCPHTEFYDSFQDFTERRAQVDEQNLA
jgi:hypothetical protein